MKTTRWRLRIDRREISYLRFVVESYDGLATLTTLNPGKGVVELRIAPGCEVQVARIVNDLKKSIMIEAMDAE